MAVPAQPPAVTPVPRVTQQAPAANIRRSFWGRALVVVALVVFVYALSYAFAWFNANQLSNRFLQDADATYSTGDYLLALVGDERFDPQTNQYIKQGGYLDVERIWSSRYSWPTPPNLLSARQRSAEIVNQRLTIEMAEDYIRSNTGRPAPYFAEIYLRLGELYEQDNDLISARDIYTSIPDLFPNRPDLIQKAQEHLDRLAGS